MGHRISQLKNLGVFFYFLKKHRRLRYALLWIYVVIPQSLPRELSNGEITFSPFERTLVTAGHIPSKI